MKKSIPIFAVILFSTLISPLSILQAQPGEKTLNRRYQNEIRDSLSDVILQRQRAMQIQARQTLAALPNDRKLYDESYISVTADLLDTLYSDGRMRLDLIYRLSYDCRHLEGWTDDYPLGVFDKDSSNSCRAICDLTKSFIEKNLSDVITAGKDIEITITSSTDGTEITSNIPYDGRYGDFRYCPVTFNGEKIRLSVDRSSGISNNCQLAYLRAQAIRVFLENEIPVLRSTHNNFRFVTQTYSDSINTHYYRRSSIEIRISDVFAETVERIRNSKMQDDYVDYNIPVTSIRTPDTYVLIIANQNYNHPFIPDVPFAAKDGASIHQYITSALGVPERQVKVLNNASKQTIQEEGIHWLTDLAKAVATHSGDQTSAVANVIIYYAGHGFTDLNGKAYLIPNGINTDKIASLNPKESKKCSRKQETATGEDAYDIILSAKETSRLTEQCLSLDELCASFNSKTVPIRNLTIVLDATFDGNSRYGRPILRADRKDDGKKKYRKPNMRSDAVVLLAADLDKTSYAFEEREHGFLTYFLLKEIKLQKDRIFSLSYHDIFAAIERKVSRESALQNRWQEISGIAGGKYKDGSWKELRIKN